MHFISDSNLHYFVDSVIVLRRANPIIKIDSTQCFATQNGDRVIKFSFLSRMSFEDIYPFNEMCFREDNGYMFPTISIFIDKHNNFVMLADELTLLCHGDFDNDGKEEYIFWSGIFNHEKYMLYYDDFKKSCSFEWSFH